METSPRKAPQGGHGGARLAGMRTCRNRGNRLPIVAVSLCADRVPGPQTRSFRSKVPGRTRQRGTSPIWVVGESCSMRQNHPYAGLPACEALRGLLPRLRRVHFLRDHPLGPGRDFPIRSPPDHHACLSWRAVRRQSGCPRRWQSPDEPGGRPRRAGQGGALPSPRSFLEYT